MEVTCRGLDGSIHVVRNFPEAGTNKTGWWDVPVPFNHAAQREAYLAGKAEEQV